MKKIWAKFAIAAISFCFIGAVQANAVDPSKPVAGQSQLALSQQWWQWALGIPAATNPLIDSTGEFANLNNNGSVFFLAGNFGGKTVRTITISYGKSLFLPLINNIDVEAPQLGPSCFDPPNDSVAAIACALAFISPSLELNQLTDLHATLDGQDLLTFSSQDFRQTSTSFFDISLPVDNLFGLPSDSYPSVSDGYWLALQDIPVGNHVLKFGGTQANGFQVDVTANLNVVPEPASGALLFSALIALVSANRDSIIRKTKSSRKALYAS